MGLEAKYCLIKIKGRVHLVLFPWLVQVAVSAKQAASRQATGMAVAS
jgi:hypothetical protein